MDRRLQKTAAIAALATLLALVACADDSDEASPETDAPVESLSPTEAEGSSSVEAVPETTAVPETIAVPETVAAPETTAAPDTTAAPEADVSAQVDVAVECSRGTTLSALPFDAELVDFLAGTPDDTRWVTQVATITNGSDVAVQVAPGFVVRYLDEAGTAIGEAAFDEPFPPALWAAPGQTVRRNIVRFDAPGLPGPVADAELAERLYADLDSCQVGDDVVAAPVAFDELVDPVFADEVEVVSCGVDDVGGRYVGTFRVRNPGDEAVTIDLAFEILDGAGNRLGIGGNLGDQIPPSEQIEITGFAASFTVFELDKAEDCAVLSLAAS